VNDLMINGYSLTVQNGEAMVRDTDLADKLGYARPYDVRKLIKRMISRGQIKPNLFVATHDKKEGRGRPGTAYYLSQSSAIKVITKSETDIADEITDEVIDVFIAARDEPRPKDLIDSDPIIIKANQAKAIAQCYVEVGGSFGTSPEMAAAVAAEQARRITGFDLTPLLANNSVEEVPVNATRLGKHLGLSGRKMNTLLEDLQYQFKDIEGDWYPTEKGKPFSSNNPAQSKTSSWSGYQLLWYPKVIEEIKKEAA